MGTPAGDLGDPGEIVVEIGPLAAHAKLGRLIREPLRLRLVELAPPRAGKRGEDEEPSLLADLRDSSHDSRGDDVLAVDGRAPSPSERADPDRPAVLVHLDER